MASHLATLWEQKARDGDHGTPPILMELINAKPAGTKLSTDPEKSFKKPLKELSPIVEKQRSLATVEGRLEKRRTIDLVQEFERMASAEVEGVVGPITPATVPSFGADSAMATAGTFQQPQSKEDLKNDLEKVALELERLAAVVRELQKKVDAQ